MELSELFSRCLSVNYTRVGKTADYAVLREGDVLYIFFEDSDGREDWISNLDFPAKAYRRMGRTVWFAHRGFLRVWKMVEPYIARHIADKRITKIITAGYSHGAALAVLCHEYIWFHRPDLRGSIEGYGFAAPRVFWGLQTPNLRQRWQRFFVIRNRGDIVTHLPPAFLGYSHVGTVLTIGERCKYTPMQAHYAENILHELYVYERSNHALPKECPHTF